jgi:hypothetical protein
MFNICSIFGNCKGSQGNFSGNQTGARVSPLDISLPVCILALFNRVFGHERITLMSMGTGKSLAELSGLLSAYKSESPS